MSLISVAQQSGDVSAELYSKYAAQGCISMPRMDGVEDLVVKMQMKEGAAGNPFNSGSAERPPTLPDRGGMAPLGVPGISPPSSQVSFLYHICSPLRVLPATVNVVKRLMATTSTAV